MKYLIDPISIPYFFSLIDLIPSIPSFNSIISNDFTYKGRSGITNLGSTCYVSALLQALNAIPHLSNSLFNLNLDNSSLFLIHLREFFAQEKYIRGSLISARNLVDTFKNFDDHLQEDAEEFLNKLLNRMQDDLKGSNELTKDLTGEITTSIYYNNNLLSNRKESFFYISLPTKDLLNLNESFKVYFQNEVIQDYPIENSEIKSDVIRKLNITKWPNYLILQLQRWTYGLDCRERTKLVHEFDFPFNLITKDICENTTSLSPEFNYKLTAVVVHQGSVESGHYIAIVEGEDKDWYVCNDQEIEYFALSELPSWSFGIMDDIITSKNELLTAYLLFYRREDLDNPSFIIPTDLTQKMNILNQNNWNSIIFFSNHFIDFIYDFFTQFSSFNNILELFLLVLFKIVILDENYLDKWINYLNNIILNNNKSILNFFNFL